MNMIRYNPHRWLDFPFDRFFDDFLPRSAGEQTGEGAYVPRVDIVEDKETVRVTAELPGVDRDKLSVELENNILTISAEKHAEQTEEKEGIYRSERVYGTFKRSFRVPNTVNSEEISADYSDGVLRVTLPKRPEVAPRQIEIKSEHAPKKLKAS